MYIDISLLLLCFCLSTIIFCNLNVCKYNYFHRNNIKAFNLSSPLWSCPVSTSRYTKFTSQYNEDKYVITYFKKMKKNPYNRVFLEIGAYNGYDMSNTYALENGYGWKGLLIEGGPNIYRKLLKTYRPRSIKLNYAICSDDSYVEYIDNAGGLGGIKKYKNNKYGKDKVLVKCSPISKIIKENGIRYIDVFSLDVEGAEENVLNTFDWDIPVRIWIVELNALKSGGNSIEKQKCKNVIKILKEHGYFYLGVSSNKSVNEFYYDKYFDKKIKSYLIEEQLIYKYKKCQYI